MSNERMMLTQFIKLYSTLPCLWDVNDDGFKMRERKADAWELLAEKLLEFDPEADVTKAKKKIENLRTSYNRELKKIYQSKVAGASGEGVHKPSLWYFNLLDSFLPKPGRWMRDPGDGSDEELQHSEQEETKAPEPKKSKLEELQDSPSKFRNKNSFGEYIVQELAHVEPFQRHVAEKLISDVLFLARTRNLGYDSKIESPRSADSSPTLTIDCPNTSNVYSNRLTSPTQVSPVSQFATPSNRSNVNVKPPHVEQTLVPAFSSDEPIATPHIIIKTESLENLDDSDLSITTHTAEGSTSYVYLIPTATSTSKSTSSLSDFRMSDYLKCAESTSTPTSSDCDAKEETDDID